MTDVQAQQLKTELQNDPMAIGYAALISAGNDLGLASFLNDLTKATSGPAVSVTSFTSAKLFHLFDATEFAALTAVPLARLQVLMATGTIDTTDANTRTLLAATFPTNGPTRAAMTAALTRVGTRAEQLFGFGTVLTSSDVALALRGAK